MELAYIMIFVCEKYYHGSFHLIKIVKISYIMPVIPVSVFLRV